MILVFLALPPLQNSKQNPDSGVLNTFQGFVGLEVMILACFVIYECLHQRNLLTVILR